MSGKQRFVAFREDEEIINLMDQVSKSRGIGRSDFIREAIRKCLADLSFFTPDVKKALGVAKEGGSHA